MRHHGSIGLVRLCRVLHVVGSLFCAVTVVVAGDATAAIVVLVAGVRCQVASVGSTSGVVCRGWTAASGVGIICSDAVVRLLVLVANEILVIGASHPPHTGRRRDRRRRRGSPF
ncbi:hypothetical protein BCV70DRAFT_29576 [Testicularia cyperi]|uniref:Uncharacterized protein n=1 Tax=Testicularia cyperi TaxID=1882483 RepID=A0A317XN86_9BASI|nr:hypothetical protein BCV70DRAFT_29576 [Testicularia cyperi]